MMQKPSANQGWFSFLGFFETVQENHNIDLLKHVDHLIREIPSQLNMIESRAELCLPILKHVTDINIKIKEPILILQKRLENLKRMK